MLICGKLMVILNRLMLICDRIYVNMWQTYANMRTDMAKCLMLTMLTQVELMC